MAGKKTEKKMSVADCLGNDGPLPTIPWGDQTVKVFRNCPEVVGHMETEVARQVRANLKKLGAVYDPDEYAVKVKEVEDGLVANHHAFGGPWFMAHLTGPDALALILLACVKPGCDGYTLADARRAIGGDRAAVMDALVVAVPGFFAAGADQRGISPAQLAPLVDKLVAGIRRAKGSSPSSPPTTS